MGKSLIFAIFCLLGVSYAGMYAITETGEKVFLRDNGTWNRVKGDEADVLKFESSQLKLNAKFKNFSLLSMEKRNELLPKGISEKELARQIKKLPKTKLTIYIDPKQVVKARPRMVELELLNSRGQRLHKKVYSDNRAYSDGTAGWLVLADITFKKELIGKYKLIVKDNLSSHTMEYVIESK